MTHRIQWLRSKLTGMRFHVQRSSLPIGASLMRCVLRVALFWQYRRPVFRPTVITGVSFGFLGGLKNHLLAIKQHSRHRVGVLPDGISLRLIHRFGLQHEFKQNAEQWLKNYVVHSHVEPWFVEQCARLANSGATWIHTYHTVYFQRDWDTELDDWKRLANDRLFNVARHAHVRISVSRWLQEYLRAEHQIETTYVPNGIDIQMCDAASASRFLRTHKIENFVLFTGGLSDIKNPLDFVRLAAALPEHPCLMVGRGLTQDALQQKFAGKLPDNLHILEALPRDQLLDSVAACRAFVMTSRSEGLPTAMMEAMALQKPVVGCNCYGMREVIDNEQHGFLYEAGNVDDLIVKTREAVSDIGRHKGALARQRILANYDWRIVIPKLDELYSEAIQLRQHRI
jgi:glycosyltransferase involved in cell wall biosynthesis